MIINKKISFWGVFLLLILNTSVWAGTTGKIKGVVVDAQTGDPLPGVKIVLSGTQLGAATNTDGSFIILNIPPGYYDVSASMIGYKSLTKQGVQVMVDRTINVDFRLDLTILEGETVTIQAERPLVKRDETSKTSVLDFRVFSEMPIEKFDEAVAAQAGIITDEAGDLHLRGGRAGEIAYMIDGVLVQDPFYKGSTEGDASNILLDKYLIQELQVMTGAFGAEYGQAMSGVINIVTKEGAMENYSGRIEYETQTLNESPFRKVDWMLSSDLVDIDPGEEDQYQDALRWYITETGDTVTTAPASYAQDVSQYAVPDFNSIPGIGDLPTLFGSPFYGYFSANLSGPVPFIKNLSFFVSDKYANNYSYLPFGYDASREFNGKLTYRFKSLKINSSFQRSKRYYKPYEHEWKYIMDGYEDFRDIVDRESIDITHTLSSRMFYTLRLSHYSHQYYRHNPNRSFKVSDLPEHIYSNPDSLDDAIENGYTIIDGTDTTFIEPSDWVKGQQNSDGFYVRGDRGMYEDNSTATYTIRFDLVSQFGKNHEIKSGFEYKNFHVSRDRWRYPWVGTAHYVEIFEHDPNEFAVYLQDKMEYERFVLNLGLRFDYFDANHTMFEDIYVPGTLDETSGEWVPAEEKPVDPQSHLSPRLGIAYPVTDRIVFHSSYGHFYETPSFYEIYKHHDVTVGGSPLIGNPKIKSQKTVQYEFGVKTQFSENWAFDMNAYFKDITDLAASTYKLVFPYNFTVFDNSDYASVKGVDFSLERKEGEFFTGIFNYSLSVAKGNESSSRYGYDNYRGADVSLRPNREFYLDFDRRHDISLNVIFKTPRDFGPDFLGGKPLSQWNFNILMQIASGLPYTPYVEESSQDIFLEKNTGRKPWFAQMDIRLLKTFTVSQHMDIAGFLVIKNVFNRLNTNYVCGRTGKAWDDGLGSSHSQDSVHNPENVGIPRLISAGLRFTF